MSEWWSYRLSDFLLFSPDVYHRLIEQYLRDVWPARILWTLAGIGLLLALARPGRKPPGRVLIGVVAAGWLWVALAFHLQRYATINWAATWFAGGFVLEAVLLCLTGVAGTIRLDGPPGPGRGLGLGLLGYAVVAQPLVDRLARGSWAARAGSG